MTTPDVVTEARAAAEVIGQLDEDWAVPCDFGSRIRRQSDPWPCGDPAEWIAWTTECCPERIRSVLLCDKHCTDLVEWPGVCRHCREPFNPGRLGFRLIEPLNRRTT